MISLIFIPLGWEGANKWLPYGAAINAVADDGFNDDILSRPWGLVYFAAVSLAIVGIGTFLDERRDA